MKDEKCAIVYDLLPNYVDKLTSSVTNKYIEEHLNNCMVCEQAFEDMKSDIELEEIQDLYQDNNFINAFKYIGNKIKSLELIIVVLTVLLIVQLVI